MLVRRWTNGAIREYIAFLYAFAALMKGDYMDKTEFAQELILLLKNRFADREISVQNITKNNGIELTGIVIRQSNVNISPTIYIDGYYEEYLRGEGIEKIAEKLGSIYSEEICTESIDVSFFENFSSVRKGICYKLINTEKNRKLLYNIPHIDYMDLSICFFYSFNRNDIDGSILIRNSHLKLWNVSAEELLKAAKENTNKLYPWELIPMSRVIYGYFPDNGSGREIMYVLTNKKRLGGAGCILYDGVARRIADMLSDSFYIIPSSVHELIIIKEEDVPDKEDIKRMIGEVNNTCVSPEDMLSDSLYFYDSWEDKLMEA